MSFRLIRGRTLNSQVFPFFLFCFRLDNIYEGFTSAACDVIHGIERGRGGRVLCRVPTAYGAYNNTTYLTNVLQRRIVNVYLAGVRHICLVRKRVGIRTVKRHQPRKLPSDDSIRSALTRPPLKGLLKPRRLLVRLPPSSCDSRGLRRRI